MALLRRLVTRVLCALGVHHVPENFRSASVDELATRQKDLWHWPCRGCRVLVVCLPDDRLWDSFERWRQKAYRGQR
jgi:hypothetical protein